jgi:hypothetical protein
MPIPNFFIVGAPKAGTDALFYDLEQHPEVYMSPLKEPCFFSSEIRPENFHPSLQPKIEASREETRRYLDAGMPGKRFGGIISRWEDYLKLFSRVTHEKAIGEGSVCYLWSETSAAAIASAAPHARIVIVLMDPAERAFHQYLKSVSDGTVRHSFRKHLQLAMQSGPELGVYHPFLDFGNYFDQVKRYMDRFPSHQLYISLYEELRGGYAGWFSRLLLFLGVNPAFVPAHSEIPSTPHLLKLRGLQRLRHLGKHIIPEHVRARIRKHVYQEHLPELNAEDRAILVRYYRDNILKLQDLIQKDLTTWLH